VTASKICTTNECEGCNEENIMRPCCLTFAFRSCLKRLSSAKKNVSLEGVTEETIADGLKQLLEKGENTSGPIFLDMGPKIIECCTFLVRCCQRLVQPSALHSKQHKGMSPVVKIYKNALTTFFTKR
jgi:hypothetical protein